MLKNVALAGLLAGALDIAFACGYWAVRADVPAQRILQSVAAGLQGSASYQGGWSSATLGLVLHFLIAIGMAWVYFLAAGRWRLLVRRPWLCGAAYGVFLYGVMQFVVLPLSAVPDGGGASGDVAWLTAAVAAHVFLVGMPIAGLAARASSG